MIGRTGREPGQGSRGPRREDVVGFEIVYCSACGNRLMRWDFEEGRAIRSGRGGRCTTCADKGTKRRRAPDRLPSLPATPAPGSAAGPT